MDPLLRAATVRAIADLGVGGLTSEEDIRPALAAAGIPEVSGESTVEAGMDSLLLFVAGPREDIQASLSALDLTRPECVDKVLRFAARIAETYAALKKTDRAKLVRLRNALADDGYELKMEGSGMTGFSIDKRGIAKMMKEIQHEFDKHPISVPVEAAPQITPKVDDSQEGSKGSGPQVAPKSGDTIIYHGPVITIHGNANGAQLAWDNEKVTQSQRNKKEQIASGFEPIAQAIAKTLEGLHAVGLDDPERQGAEAAASAALTEVTNTQPDKGRLRNALAALKGYLTPIALGLAAGSAGGAQEWAHTAIEQLGTPF
jgi:hypothetical protein